MPPRTPKTVAPSARLASSRAGSAAHMLGWLLLGLALTAGLWAAAVATHPDDGAQQVLSTAWAVPAGGDEFPADPPPQLIHLPDDWTHSRPSQPASTWYRLRFDLGGGLQRLMHHDLLAAYVERACTNLEVRLNGQLVYTGGRMREPLTRNCYHPQVFALPALLLRPEDNWLDIRVVGYPLEAVSARERAAGLSEVRLGSLDAMQRLASHQRFWNVTVAEIVAGVLLLVSVISFMLAWVRRLSYMLYFGLANLGFSVVNASVWLHDLPLSQPTVEILNCLAYAPLSAWAVLFVLSYAGFGMARPEEAGRARLVHAGLWLQCVAVAAAFLVAGPHHIFAITRVCYHLFGLECVAAIVYFLVHARRQHSAEFWVMGGLLCAVIASIALELAYQDALLPRLGISMAHFVLPALFCFIAFRLIQVYAQALQAAERSRTELEHRVREITAEVEHSVNQMAQARIEKIAEKERKRIASDLHDDLGAKLLTIIHTSDSDRISNLAREALEEMRLSVRGLTGRPVQLADAMADWRSETVSRLGETSIRVDWKSPADIPPLALSARTYVQTTRILREAVSNIIKHSGSSHCDIAAVINRADFQIVIHDNGRGIPMQLDGKLDRGHGMSSMKSRAKQLQGQCLVESGPNLGTIIRLTLPLEIPSTNEPIAATMSRLSSKAGPHEANPPA